MLLIDTYLGKSRIHGTGLFANQDIPEGTRIWKRSNDTCTVYSIDRFIKTCSRLGLQELISYLHYSYVKDGVIFHLTDDTRFINHSETPNLLFINQECEISTRFISKGEELTENYYSSYDLNDFMHFFPKIENLEYSQIIRMIKSNFNERKVEEKCYA